MVKLRESIEEAKQGDLRKAAEARNPEAELYRVVLVSEAEMPAGVAPLSSAIARGDRFE